MVENKFCKRCGKSIGNIYEMDYYRFLSLKYCENCKDIVKREQNAARMREIRAKSKIKRRLIDEELRLQQEKNKNLQDENQELRRMIEELRECRN